MSTSDGRAMTNGDYTVPEVTTRFPGPVHPDVDEITDDTQEYYDRFLRPLIKSDHEDHVGSFVACGGTYVSYVYPAGRTEPTKLIGRMYTSWITVDDVLDDSTSFPQIRDLGDMFRRAIDGKPVADGRFRGAWELFASDGWDARVLDLVKYSLHRYMDATIDLRTIEIRRRPVTVAEYLDLRLWNNAMPAMYYFAAHANPGLRDALLAVRDHPAFEQAVRYSGFAIGILLDLCNINMRRAENTRYTNIARIIGRTEQTELDWPRAVARAIDYFHEYEDRMADALDRLAATRPELSTAMAHVQGGSVRWLTMMRVVGRRYGKLTEAPGNPVTHV